MFCWRTPHKAIVNRIVVQSNLWPVQQFLLKHSLMMAVDFCDYFWGEKHDGFNVIYQVRSNKTLCTSGQVSDKGNAPVAQGHISTRGGYHPRGGNPPPSPQCSRKGVISPPYRVREERGGDITNPSLTDNIILAFVSSIRQSGCEVTLVAISMRFLPNEF